MKIVPTFGNIIVKRDPCTTVTSGGIALPGASGDVPAQGTVIAVSEVPNIVNGKTIPPLLTVGDRIVFGQYDGDHVEVDTETDERLIRLKESQVLAVLEG